MDPNTMGQDIVGGLPGVDLIKRLLALLGGVGQEMPAPPPSGPVGNPISGVGVPPPQPMPPPGLKQRMMQGR